MNKRIQDYMIQAERHAMRVCGFCSHNDYNTIRNEKFAELIVQECGRYLDSPEFIGRRDLDWSIVLNEYFGLK